ncbi:DUF2852 domain-containing protein [Martelella endophytica]|uniref:Membrane protein n=1 Tax=Martelella endophytica TaxID=1486262 RepID=A0A0D5LPE5_MAREN|nr:DUF2852 domain-containing protein [Martelella endophytica]AJY45198.1 membrane protein [Martelella endophytica]
MNETALLRPAWTPLTIALMVVGFIVFWPLGLVMLAYIIWGDRLNMNRSEWKRSAGRAFGSCRRSMKDSMRQADDRMSSTGNAAFDEWRRSEMQRIDEERRKLDEMRAEFDRYTDELRKARDREEFDRFMRERNNTGFGGTPAPEA